MNGGITFDGGFNPDYILGINNASNIAYYDLYNMQGNSNNFLGNSSASSLLKFTANTGTGDYTKGFEFAIPLSALGNATGTIKVFAMLVNDANPFPSGVPFLSNQFLTRANNGEGSYGSGSVDFSSAAPNIISLALNATNCYSETCVTVSALPTVAAIAGTTSVCVGATTTLSNTTIGGVWSSTNTSVATINSSGLVTAIAIGTTIIKYVVTNVSGCKDSVSTTLTINTATHNSVNQTACNSYLWNGTTYTTTGVYTYSYNNSTGCASVDTLHLTINQSSFNATIATACNAYTWNGVTYTLTGIYTYSYNNSTGCASVDTLQV